MENNNKTGKNSAGRLIIIIIAVILIIVGVLYSGTYLFGIYKANQNDGRIDELTSPTVVQSTTSTKVSNPIDFKSLKAQNSDIYAWIKVDGTKVDYPIVQSNKDDNFYLKHSAADKSWSDSGAVYTQSHNTKSFDDPVTVIYGHNGYGDTMFTTLHKFAAKDFFDKHSSFCIYTEERKLTYNIVSAFKYDDRHIMNSFDFQDMAQLEEFQNTVQNPKAAMKQTRSAQIDSNSKIVVLSTCITGQKSNRYLVCGVLVNDEQTN